jgi:hypothetical protein
MLDYKKIFFEKNCLENQVVFCFYHYLLLILQKYKTMKKLCIISLMIACCVSCSDNIGQDIVKEVKVNNKKLQSFLLGLYDQNKDGILSEEEALNVTQINVIFSQEPLDGLENFPNLELLEITGGEFTELDVSKNFKLKDLFCRQNKLKSLDLSNNSELELLACESGELQSINLGSKPKLTKIFCAGNKLTSLNVDGCPDLNLLYCGVNLLTEINVGNNPNLEWLYCSSNQIATIDVTKNQKLKYFHCFKNKALTTLDLSNNFELLEFSCEENLSMINLDISNNLKLENLICSSMNLETLDVSNNLKLKYLHCNVSTNLHTLYMKTGQTLQKLSKDAHTTIVYL